MKRFYLTTVLTLVSLILYAPPNCEIYKDNADCYQACKAAMKAIRCEQGSYRSQLYFDESIELCENFAYAYMEKAVPFLKRGQFVKWKILIDKAVELSPHEYLGYRGWCRFQFLGDYEGAINDIEQLQSLVNYDVGYCQSGDYHLNVVLALCYREIGDLDKARVLFQQQMSSGDHHQGLYDFYHLGVLEYEDGNYQKAVEYLKNQIEVNDYMGETYYFLALAYKNLGQIEEYIQYLDLSEEYYRTKKYRNGSYTAPIDEIFLMDIVEEKNTVA